MNEAVGALAATPLARLPAKPYAVPESLDDEVGAVTDEMYERMYRMQNAFRVVNPGLEILKYRRVLVDWIADVGEHFHFNTSTIHVAVALLDRVMQTANVVRRGVQTVALACLVIAGKYEEMENTVPPVGELLSYAKEETTARELNEMEISILQRLDWNVTEFVPLHFLGYYFCKGVVFVEDTVDQRPMMRKVPKYILKYHNFFAELCTQDYHFQAYSSSLTAAAIIAASRRALRIEPLWRPELTALTGASFEDLRQCYSALWEFFERSFPESAAGYGP